MRILLFLMTFSLLLMESTIVRAQDVFASQSGWENIANQEMQNKRTRLKSSGNQIVARNLMIVKEVADYKSGDERYSPDFEALSSDREYQEKLGKIMANLSNRKLSNSKNKDVINILNDAGNKLYNLLAN